MAKEKIPTYGERRESAGLGQGFKDDLDLETIKVAELCENETAFVIYDAIELDSQYDEQEKVWLVQIGDPKGPTHKAWMGHSALRHALSDMVEHELLPCATKIIKRESKAGRQYYDFER